MSIKVKDLPLVLDHTQTTLSDMVLFSLTIGGNVFAYHTAAANESALNKIRMNKSCYKLNANAFLQCISLTEFSAPSTDLSVVGDTVFSTCTSLSSVDIKNTQLTAVSKNMFYKCTALSSIELPETVRYLSSCAFGTITHLTSLYLPVNIKNVPSDMLTATNMISTNKGRLYLKLSGTYDTDHYYTALKEVDNNKTILEGLFLAQLKNSKSHVCAEVVNKDGSKYHWTAGGEEQMLVYEITASKTSSTNARTVSSYDFWTW